MDITKEDIGKLVQYFHGGWRIGHIDGLVIKKKKVVAVKVKPVGAIGANPHCKQVPTDDIKLIAKDGNPL